MTRMLVIVLLVGGWRLAHADLCSSRSARNARPVTGCSSYGITLAISPKFSSLTDPDFIDPEGGFPEFDGGFFLDGGVLLAVDFQVPILDLIVIRSKGLVQSIPRHIGSPVANAAVGVALAHQSFETDIGVSLGVEYAPAWAGTNATWATLPTLGRYLTPETQQGALQFSIAHLGRDGLDLRADTDLVILMPDRGANSQLIQIGLTLVSRGSQLDSLGHRFGVDYVHAIGPHPSAMVVSIGSAHLRALDVGVGIDVVATCPDRAACYSTHLVLDFAIPL